MSNEKYYTARQASDMLGVSLKTIQRWDNQGKMKAFRTPTNRRVFPQSEIDKMLGVNNTKTVVNNDHVVIYGRVSSHDQKVKGDLERQIGSMMLKVNGAHSKITTITDVGSGLNDKRKGLVKLMDMAKNKEISKIYITYKDRLTRFGFNYLELYFNSHDVELVVMNDDAEDKSPQQELIEDLMSIISSFSGKLYGLRSGKNKKVEDEIKKTIESNL